MRGHTRRGRFFHHGSGLSRGKALFFATLAGAQEALLEHKAVHEEGTPASLTLVKPVRFAPEKWEKIQARVAEVHLPPSTYDRETALGYRLSGRINSAAVASLARIGNNLIQVTRIANTTGRLDHSQYLEAVLNELLDALRRLA